MTLLEGVRLGDTKTPYVWSADGALRAAGMWDDETFMLLGLTGLGFHVVADSGTCPSGPTSYDWSHVHSEAMTRIGVSSRCIEYTGATHSSRKGEELRRGTYESLRDDAIHSVKSSIDRGVPAVFRTVDWAEFAVINGYDDSESVFFVTDIGGHADPVLYTNLGRPHGFPSLFVQVLDERLPFDLERAARESLQYATRCWRGTAWPAAGNGYDVGASAYRTLIGAFERADSDPLGLRYILLILADARAGIAEYVRRLQSDDVVPSLGEAVECFGKAAELLAKAQTLHPAEAPFERPLDVTAAPEAAGLLREAAELESRAIESIEAAL
jgi:hypothetical protein